MVTLESPLGFTNTLHDLKPDLALIDVLMPALAGTKLVQIFRPRHPRSSIGPMLVLHSSIRESELSRLVDECGADGYILKSRRLTDLPAAVGRFLASRRGKGSIAS